MRRRKRNRRSNLDYSKLEDKVYLTVTTSVSNTGTLAVNGFADGPVQINAVGPQTYSVTDNGVQVATVNGVRENMVVRLNPGPFNDNVQINLGTQTLFNVVVELQDGNNNFSITGTQSALRVIYRGGAGNDTVSTNLNTTLMTAAFGFGGTNTFTANNDSLRFRFRGGDGQDTVTVNPVSAGYIGAVLHGGNDRFTSTANVQNNLYVNAGAGDDRIDENGQVGTLSLQLGNGANSTFLDGAYNRLFIRGGFGSDALFLNTTMSVARHAGLVLLGGNDFVRVAGDFNSSFYFNATDGNDEVFTTTDSSIFGDFTTLFGAGTNKFTHNGDINGDLYVASRNVNDNYRVNGDVGGTTRL